MEVAGIGFVLCQLAALAGLSFIAWHRAADLGRCLREQDQREAELLRRTRVEIEA